VQLAAISTPCSKTAQSALQHKDVKNPTAMQSSIDKTRCTSKITEQANADHGPTTICKCEATAPSTPDVSQAAVSAQPLLVGKSTKLCVLQRQQQCTTVHSDQT
jgi:hypothetical protein